MDSTIRLWDLVAGRASAVLTNHKKAVRSVLVHPREYTFVSGAADNLKKWKCPEGRFLHNLSGPQAHHNAILHGLAVVEADGYAALASLGASPLRRVLTSGGGAQNPQWTALRQRLLGVPTARASSIEASYGAALLACRGAVAQSGSP